MNGDVEVGQVIRVTKMYQATSRPHVKENPNMVIGKGTYALVTYVSGEDEKFRGAQYRQVTVIWLEPEKLRDPNPDDDEDNVADFLTDEWDRFTVVPPKRWPDRVCVAVAKIKLGVSDDD